MAFIAMGLLTATPALAAAKTSSVKVASAESPQMSSEYEATPENASNFIDSFSVSYFGIFSGPSLGNPSSLQPTPTGEPNPDKPLDFDNYLTLGYGVNDNIAISGTARYAYQPVRGQAIRMIDPFARISHDELIHVMDFNLASEIRFHFPVTHESRLADLLAGFESYSFASLPIGSSRFTLMGIASIRYNVFGRRGSGEDLQTYFAPIISYQLSPTVSLVARYEMYLGHIFGDKPFVFTNDGTDLEPGVYWQVTQRLSLNPYINLYTGNKVTLKSSSVGMLMNWAIF